MADLKKIFLTKEFQDSWNLNYKKLRKTIGSAGKIENIADPGLHAWIEHQRDIKDLLPQELKEKLMTLGVDLEQQKDSWEEMYQELNHFVLRHGHAHVPADPEYDALRDWLTRQIINRSLLTDEQFQKLDSSAVDWEMTVSRDHRWEVMYQR